MNVYLYALSWKLGCEKAFTIIHSANLTATIPSFSGSECVVSSALLLELSEIKPKNKDRASENSRLASSIHLE